MNILVTGANGQLGSHLRLAEHSSAHNWIFSDLADAQQEQRVLLEYLGCTAKNMETSILDVCDGERMQNFVSEKKIDLIVNCAAYTNVEAAEDNVESALMLNAKVPGIMAALMAKRGGRLIHISTDYVFGAQSYNCPCREDFKGEASGVYGKTKLCGEREIFASGVEHLIFRTSWLYSEFGKNFMKTMVSLTSTRREVNVVFDQVGTPTYARDLAFAIVNAVDSAIAFSSPKGVYNFSNEGVCSWYDFATEIAFLAGNENCDIKPCHSNEFKSKVIRPAYSVLDKTKYKETFNASVPYWRHSLKDCMTNYMGYLQGKSTGRM